MEKQDLINLLENLESPDFPNPAHQRKLRAALINSPVFQKKGSMFTLRNFAYALAVVVILAGATWVGLRGMPGPKQLANNPPVQQGPKPTPQTPENPPLAIAPQPNWQTVTWHDPSNTILGYKFDIPNTWVELPASSEREMTVASCQPNTPGCEYVSLDIEAISSSQTMGFPNNLISGYVASEDNYTQSTTTIGGLPATQLTNPRYGNDGYVYLEKDNEWFIFQLQPGHSNVQENNNLLNKIISTFTFTAQEASQAPAEYDLLKDIDKWQLTYQLKNNGNFYLSGKLVCADGRTGNTSSGYVFSMYSDGYGEAPGDINTPYNKVVTALKADGWVECGVPESQQDPTNGTYNVFIKDSKLIGVFKRYSMGTGNNLTVLIQYDNN